MELLLFIKTQISSLASGKINRNSVRWAAIWRNKAEHAYQKAEIMFRGDKISNDTYNSIIQSEKKIKKSLRMRVIILTTLVSVFVIYLFIMAGRMETTKYNSSYDWPENEFTSILPKPDIENGKIESETQKQFQFELYKVTPEQFEEYVKACRKLGFTVDLSRNDDVFTADNQEGYSLSITYYEYSDEMQLTIDSNNVTEKEN